MVFISSQVDVRGVGFLGEQRRPAGGCGPGSQSGRGGEPLVQDSGPWRIQVAAATAAATPVLHLYRLPAEVSVTQRNMVWPGSLWGFCCCAADNCNDKNNKASIGVVPISQRTSDPNLTERELFTTYPNVSVLPHCVDEGLPPQVCCFHIHSSFFFSVF